MLAPIGVVGIDDAPRGGAREPAKDFRDARNCARTFADRALSFAARLRAESDQYASYPAAAKRFRHSWGAKRSMSLPMARHRPSTVRSAALRKSAFRAEPEPMESRGIPRAGDF
jgi:hypothetical protein